MASTDFEAATMAGPGDLAIARSLMSNSRGPSSDPISALQESEAPTTENYPAAAAAPSSGFSRFAPSRQRRMQQQLRVGSPPPQQQQNQSGRAEAPQKRSREAGEDVSAEENKRCKTAMNSLAEEYICPITTELPVDPVTADDGRVYERWAIEEHIKKQGRSVKSPFTNQPMMSRLTDAVQVRNSIRILVESGAINGELAKQWKERMKEKDLVEKMKKKAQDGDVKAMCSLGVWYHRGKKGLAKDTELSFQWHKKAADLQYPRSMSIAGTMLSIGLGVKRNVTQGMVMIAVAAGMGVDAAAYNSGVAHYEGSSGLTKNPVQAKYWLKKATDGSCTFRYMKEEMRNEALEYLSNLDNS